MTISCFIRIEPEDIGAECDEAQDFAEILNSAGKHMSNDEEDVKEWMNEVVCLLDSAGQKFGRAFAAMYFDMLPR